MKDAFALQSAESILICSIRLIGDVILTTPLIDLLKKNYPGASIDVLVASGTGGFLERDPRIRHVLTVPSKQVQEIRPGNFKYSSLSQLFLRYDIAITMNASDRGNVAVICAGKKIRIGFYENNGLLKSGWKKLLLSVPLYYDTSEHVIMHAKHVAEALGIIVEKLEVNVYWNNDDSEEVKRFLRYSDTRRPYFVIHPFARWKYKYWDMDSFVCISDRIARTHGLVPVWTSSPSIEECDGLRKYAARCAFKPKIVEGSFSLNQMACLIAGASLYIGLDTAVTHIAASTGVPVVALFGPTETHRWFPWDNSGPLYQMQNCRRESHRNGKISLLQKECQHANCIRPECNNPCMQRITDDDVFSVASLMLKEWAPLKGQND